MAPPAAAGGNFGRSVTHATSVTSTDPNGSNGPINSKSRTAPAPKSGGFPGSAHPGDAIVDDVSVGQFPEQDKTEREPFEINRPGPEDGPWAPFGGYQRQPDPYRDALDPGRNPNHPLTAGVHRAAIGGPSSGLGRPPIEGPDGFLTGVVLPRRPMAPAGGAAMNLFEMP